MRRFVAGLSSFLFAIIFAVPTTAGSSACPVSPPVPLRGLYIKSDLVVVGKIGTPGKWKIQPRDGSESENFRDYNRTVPVQIEETIKGTAPENLLVRETQTRWVSPSVEQKPQTPGIVINVPDEPEFSSSLAEDTGRRLFFLDKNTDGGAYYQQAYAGRHFQPEQKDLPLFISRLRELHAIYSAPVPSKQMIVEWVVAMAENPATRYEGAYELRQALYGSGREEEPEEGSQESEQADAPEAADAADADQENAADIDAIQETHVLTGEETAGNTITRGNLDLLVLNLPAFDRIDQDYSDIAKLLTPSQKERLIQSFLNIQFTYKVAEKSESDEDEDVDAEEEEDEGPPEIKYESVLSEADEMLLNTVGEFNDSRVVQRLIAELPAANKYGPRYAFSMIEILSAYFNDEKLEKLSEKYSDVYWGSDNELIDEEETAQDTLDTLDTLDAPTAPPAAADKTPGEPPPAQADGADSEARALKKARAENYVPSKTYGQRRTELLAQVLARCAELGEKKAK